jgi:hypothetical protein
MTVHKALAHTKSKIVGKTAISGGSGQKTHGRAYSSKVSPLSQPRKKDLWSRVGKRAKQMAKIPQRLRLREPESSLDGIVGRSATHSGIRLRRALDGSSDMKGLI